MRFYRPILSRVISCDVILSIYVSFFQFGFIFLLTTGFFVSGFC